MTPMIKISYCSVLIFCFAALVFGQDFDETGLAADGVIKRLSNVRNTPRASSAKLTSLAPETEIRVIDRTRRNGYLRVLYGNGEQGYVYYKNIEIAQEFLRRDESTAAFAARERSEPCVDGVFANCPARGCYAPNTPGALFNEAKRRLPAGANPVTINFADLQQMQDEVGNRLGLRSQNKALSAVEREQLKNIRVANGFVGEGALVRIIGFIPAGDGLKGGSIETVNCKFTETNQRDIHIPLVAQSGFTEFQGIVIEMIPQGRAAGWTLTKLRKAQRERRRVMVLGGLFYDNEHLVNKDPARPLSGHSRRFSIWEIHPVTQFFVCTRNDNSCSGANMNGWIALESFQ